MTLEIRPLAATDRAAWDPLFVGYLTFYERTLPPDVIDECWRRFMDENHPVQARGAFEDGTLLGIVHFFAHPSTTMLQDTCYLQDIFTVPEARGKGVGKALIERVYVEAQAMGYFRVYWHTRGPNAVAQVLYNKLATRLDSLVYAKNF
jgi:GNAT superfamily N-acetyltransferase